MENKALSLQDQETKAQLLRMISIPRGELKKGDWPQGKIDPEWIIEPVRRMTSGGNPDPTKRPWIRWLLKRGVQEGANRNAELDALTYCSQKALDLVKTTPHWNGIVETVGYKYLTALGPEFALSVIKDLMQSAPEALEYASPISGWYSRPKGSGAVQDEILTILLEKNLAWLEKPDSGGTPLCNVLGNGWILTQDKVDKFKALLDMGADPHLPFEIAPNGRSSEQTTVAKYAKEQLSLGVFGADGKPKNPRAKSEAVFLNLISEWRPRAVGCDVGNRLKAKRDAEAMRGSTELDARAP